MKKRLGKCLIFVLFQWFILTVGVAQALEDPAKSANDNYQAALQAYLSGDFDQAILLDSKALQTDPQDKKAQSLLGILVSEKDTANKTVIWIGGKPAVVQENTVIPEAPAAVTIFKDKETLPSPRPVTGSRKLSELETRVQTVAFLMERDSFNQYREMSSAQAQTSKRLYDIAVDLKGMGWGIRISNLLFLLALAVAGMALWKSWKNGEDIKRRMRSIQQPPATEEKNRVVNFHRA